MPLRRFSLSKSIGKLVPLKEELDVITKAIVASDALESIEYLLTSSLIEEKTKKQLLKYQKKLLRTTK